MRANKLQGGGGSGLGLWVARSIMEAHKGAIGVTSEGENHGSTFYVDIPAMRSFIVPEEEIILDPSLSTKYPPNAQKQMIQSQLQNDGMNVNDMVDSSATIIGGVATLVSSSHENQLETDFMKDDKFATRISSVAPRNIKSAFLVDDSTINRKMCNRLLKSKIEIIDEACDGIDCIEKFIKKRKEMGYPVPEELLATSCIYNHTKNNTANDTHDEEDDSSVTETNTNTNKGLKLTAANLAMMNNASMSDTTSNHSNQSPKRRPSAVAHGGNAAAVDPTKSVSSNLAGHLPYDVIMMDFVMPRMNGPDCVRELRRLGYEGLIVGVTGNSMQEDINTFLEAGVNRVMVKPLDINLFVSFSLAWVQSYL